MAPRLVEEKDAGATETVAAIRLDFQLCSFMANRAFPNIPVDKTWRQFEQLKPNYKLSRDLSEINTGCAIWC